MHMTVENRKYGSTMPAAATVRREDADSEANHSDDETPLLPLASHGDAKHGNTLACGQPVTVQ